MIDALISGKIHGQPASRTAKSGKPFVVAKVRTPVSAEDSIFVSVLCFDADAGRALLALGDGDSVALSGSLTPKVWTDRDGNAKPALDLIASAVLTPYSIKKKRQAAQAEPQQPNDTRQGQPYPPDFPDQSLDF